MNLRDVLDSPVLKRALEAGEERMGKVVAGVLASERITTGLQRLVGSALQAKETFDRGVEQALHVANLPSREDVATLRKKLAELEAVIDGMAARAGQPERPGAGAPPPDLREDGGSGGE
jgi:phosphate uptake regulator